MGGVGRPDHRPDAREDHGHLHLRHARGSRTGDRREVRDGHLRPGRRLHHPGHDRPRGRAVRLRRRVRVVPGPALVAAGGGAAEDEGPEAGRGREARGGSRGPAVARPLERGGEGGSRGVHGDRPRLAQRAAHAVRGPDPQGRHRRPHARQHRAEGVPGTRRGHGVRVEGHRRAVPEGRRGDRLGHRARRHREEEPVRHADHRRRARHADQGRRLRAGLRARRRHVRRGRGRGAHAPWPKRRSAWARGSTVSSSPRRDGPHSTGRPTRATSSSAPRSSRC